MADDDDAGMAGTGGLGGLFAQFEQAQEVIQSAAAEAAATIVEGTAADGRVIVQMSGDLDAVSVHIDPSLVDPADVTMLEDLVLAAIRDGLGQIADLQEQVAGAIGGGPGGLDVAGLLGSLGNLPGFGAFPGLGEFGLGQLEDVGALGSMDIGAIAHLPGLDLLAGLEVGMEQVGDEGDEDDGKDEANAAGAPEAGSGPSGTAGEGTLRSPANGDADDSGADDSGADDGAAGPAGVS